MDDERVVRTSANSSPSAIAHYAVIPRQSEIIVVTPKKVAALFFCNKTHPHRHLGRRRGWFAAPVGRGGGWKTRDGASDKCRRLCFNCGVCSLALYKCWSFRSTFRLPLSFSFFLSVRPPSRGAPSRKVI